MRMASDSPCALYVKFLKVPVKQCLSWEETNHHCIDHMLKHMSTWTNVSRKPPRQAIVHELCALKGMQMNDREARFLGRLRLMQKLIPALTTEITKHDNEHVIPFRRVMLQEHCCDEPKQ